MTNVSAIKSAAEPGLSRREQRKLEVRGRINEAALTLFADKGVESTTVEEICEAAEVARKTFYNYYSSKQDLIRDLSDSMLYDETSNVIELALEKFDTTRERIEYIYGIMADNLQRYAELERCLVHQTLLDLSSENSQIGKRLGDLNAAFGELVGAGVRLGDVSPQYSAAFIGEMIVGLINATIINWVHDTSYPVIERIEEVKRLTLNSFLKS
ncbi:AcrR family transcriptional regulator [Litorivivens lipolytica]|uniref:AcrR family transcriptional regulator n=1 Tax=Litorivivens lipolytica TaxID=1524264 RepID=A0A7W4Z699_9GAMM|nr:TetR/AcrR family transcriptional regulator [Litorivivens lipolytica]MBB3048304.1 AcrR family transcriptional regulator [Litorivivens lipolytica]